MPTRVEGNGSSKVTIDDVRAKFREIASDVDSSVESARRSAAVVAVAAGAVLVVVAFWLGTRRGRRTQTILEIRRI